ncbi:MAG: hypothetical protein JXB49_22555 [Bacteroidales bacterium]|nr:hypothetical protein [Bacteroidales bacterium]
MKFHFLTMFVVLCISLSNGYGQKYVANIAGYDTARIFQAMAKARRGEDITVVTMGGSITQGYAASTTDKRWANQVYQWWVDSFPQSAVHFVNAGIGGTGSTIGTFRLKSDVLQYDPDFILIEFSVNDSEGSEAEKMMEALIRQMLQNDSLPGVMMLMLKQENGTTAQESHKPVGNYYKVPMISFADLIDSTVAADGVLLHDLYIDGLHPVDLGMTYIANFIKKELNNIYTFLPDDNQLPAIDTIVPAPLITDVYDHNYTYNANSLAPLTNKGWMVDGTTWKCNNSGDEASFKVDGNAFAIKYTRHNAAERGQIAVWVDAGEADTLDAYWTDTWGPGQVMNIIAENLADGEHIIHVKAIDSHSSGSTGNMFPILNIMKAGNISGAAPIAKAGGSIKCLAGTELELDGSQSYDPDGDSILAYHWTVLSKPAGSSSIVADSTAGIAHFTPDVGGSFMIGLEVYDGSYYSVMFKQTITVKGSNTAPIANAGPDKQVLLNKGYTLDGSQSSDADGDSIVYIWRIISEPAGSSISFGPLDIPTPSFRNRVLGEYVFGLTVYDSIEYSQEDTVVITASETVSVDANGFSKNVQIYPNPTNGEIHISFKLDHNSQVSIIVYSVDGKVQHELINGMFRPGCYKYTCNAKNYSDKNGIYIIGFTIGRDVYYQSIIYTNLY